MVDHYLDICMPKFANSLRRHFAFISDHQYHPLVDPYGDETGGYYYETSDNAQTTSRQGAQKSIEKNHSHSQFQ